MWLLEPQLTAALPYSRMPPMREHRCTDATTEMTSSSPPKVRRPRSEGRRSKVENRSPEPGVRRSRSGDAGASPRDHAGSQAPVRRRRAPSANARLLIPLVPRPSAFILRPPALVLLFILLFILLLAASLAVARQRLITARPLGRPLRAAVLSLAATTAERPVDAPAPKPLQVWPSTPPAGCPFPQSDTLVGISFTGRHAEYTNADTWYPSWASDGNLYSPWTDGNVNGLSSSSGGEERHDRPCHDPRRRPAEAAGRRPGRITSQPPRPTKAAIRAAASCYNGVWYYGTYCLHPNGQVPRDGITYNWPWLGPFVGFRYSTDFGKTWTQTPCTPAKPLFGEQRPARRAGQDRSPHFVDFGKNLEHSPDGKAYLVAHGRFRRHQPPLRLQQLDHRRPDLPDPRHPQHREHERRLEVRVLRRHDARSHPLWTSDFAQIKPIAALERQHGLRDHDLRRAAEEVPDVRDRRRHDYLRLLQHLHPRIGPA